MNDRPEPLIRNAHALTSDEQKTLKDAQVVVCGCGGLGGQVIENLVRIGVGNLTLFDPDVFSSSNLNRQLGALSETLGRNKAEVLAERVGRIHDLCRVKTFQKDFRMAKNFQGADVVVDCLDDVKARFELAERCHQQNLPLVHGAVNGWYGQVGVQCPGDNLLDRLYPYQDIKTDPPSVLSFTASLVASLQAAETVKQLLNKSSRLEKGWLAIDLLHGDFEYFK